jgi:hypothetical protein
MQVLQIIDNAYRATIEEQDDTVLWFTQVLRDSGAETAVLLRGGAVNYAVAKQDAAGLAFGEWHRTQPPNIAAALERLLSTGVLVYVDEDDLADRGVGEGECLAGVRRRCSLSGHSTGVPSFRCRDGTGELSPMERSSTIFLQAVSVLIGIGTRADTYPYPPIPGRCRGLPPLYFAAFLKSPALMMDIAETSRCWRRASRICSGVSEATFFSRSPSQAVVSSS